MKNQIVLSAVKLRKNSILFEPLLNFQFGGLGGLGGLAPGNVVKNAAGAVGTAANAASDTAGAAAKVAAGLVIGEYNFKIKY